MELSLFLAVNLFVSSTILMKREAEPKRETGIPPEDQESKSSSNDVNNSSQPSSVLRSRQQQQDEDESIISNDDETQAGAIAVYPSLQTARTTATTGCRVSVSPEDASSSSLLPSARRQTLVVTAQVVDDANNANPEKERQQIEDHVIQSLAQAQVIETKYPQRGGANTSKRRRARLAIMLGGLLVVVVAIVVGVTLGLVLSQSKNDSSSNQSMEENRGQATATPSLSKPQMRGSTDVPTVAPSKHPSPTPSTAPSSMPSLLGDNAFCDDAHPLRVGQSRSGEFVASQTPRSFHDCNLDVGLANNGRQFWYKTMLSNSQPLRLSAAGLRVQVARAADVSSSCSFDTCLTDEIYPTSGGMEWIAFAGVEYWIQVICQDCDVFDFIPDFGPIPFSVTLGTNDSPANAYGPLTLSRATFLPGLVLWNSTNNHGENVFPACGGASEGTTTSGSWFAVQGTGNALSASTCETVTTMDTQITVLTAGSTSSSWTCVTGNDNFCGSGQSQVSWNSVEGEVYWIVVHAGMDINNINNAGEDQSFRLRIDGEGFGDGLAAFDVCDTAGILDFNVPQTVNLFEATDDEGFAFDDFFGLNIPFNGDTIPTGLWFQVDAPTTATNMTLVVEEKETSRLSLGIVVFSGSCQGLALVTNCKEVNEENAPICLWTTPGSPERYFIYVFHGTSRTSTAIQPNTVDLRFRVVADID